MLKEASSSQLAVGVVVPVYNEAEVVRAFHAGLREVIDALPYAFSITYVNDGSSDATAGLLVGIAQSDPRVSVLELSRNFGHQAALTAGLEAARGDYVITMDGDGQHPPALIPEMLHLAESGCEVVLTQRADDPSISPFKRWTANLFYKLINRVGETNVLPGGADFRLLSRSALDALIAMPEYHRFLRGMVSWIGFRQVILPYQPAERLAGKSKYTLKKMVGLARDAIFSFSLAPLYIGLSLGMFTLFLALLEMVYVLSFWVTGRYDTLEPGWSSLMFVLLVASGIIMVMLGFIGIYIGYIFQEVKNRPVYIIRQSIPAAQSTLEGDQPAKGRDIREVTGG